jgi:phosphatidylinositol alpha-1,6-mannosyltransferase
VLGPASHVIAASAFAQAAARRLMGEGMPPTTLVPPGVDPFRFRPLSAEQRDKARADLGLDPESRLVVSVSRLVPRKGMDTLIAAAARLAPSHPDLAFAIAGDGRDRPRLQRLVARRRAPVHLLGSVADDRLPAVYGCADVFAMPCRTRWGGLEQEGFGIVFLEAAACGVAGVAGASGGSHEAVDSGRTGFVVGHPVVHGTTGLVVEEPGQPDRVAAALAHLLADPALRQAMGRAGRERAVADFSYEVLARRLEAALGRISG